MTINTCDFCGVIDINVGTLNIGFVGNDKFYNLDICKKCSDRINEIASLKEFAPPKRRKGEW